MLVLVPAAVRANPAKTLSVATFLMHFGVPRVAETLYFIAFLCLPIAKTPCFFKGLLGNTAWSEACEGSGALEPDSPRKSMAGAAGSDQELKNTVWSRGVRGLAAFAGPKPRDLFSFLSFRWQKSNVFEGSKAKVQKALCFGSSAEGVLT